MRSLLRMRVILGLLLTAFPVLHAADTKVIVPRITGLDRLPSWQAGVRQADAGKDPLVIACFGDSNTEGANYVGALRLLLQARYGDRGIGYQTFSTARSAIPGAPQVKRQGTWTDFDTSPGRNTPPALPYFAMDGFWAETEDANAVADVVFSKKPGGATHRIRVHYQVGPGLGSFSILTGDWERQRIDCAAAAPGYGVTEPFLADQFAIKKVTGKIVLLGFDSERVKIVRGENLLPGGAQVHGLGNSWGMALHLCPTEESAFKAFFATVKPDLVTIMFGTNDMHNDGRPHKYRESMTTLMQKIRKAAPEVGVLVISCPEAGQTGEGKAVEFAGIAKEVAAANGCAFWDWRSVMGTHSRHGEMIGYMGDGLHYGEVGGMAFAQLLLMQLGLNLNDPAHWPALIVPAEPTGRQQITLERFTPLNLEQVPEALKDQPVYTIWNADQKAADLQMVIAGSALALHATVYDGRCRPDIPTWKGSNLDLYISKIGSVVGDERANVGYLGLIRQLVMKATSPEGDKAVTAHQSGRDARAPDFPWRVTAREPYGYRVDALIPLEFFLLDRMTEQFYLEAAVVVAPGPGAPVNYCRLFNRLPDGGAFRDNTQAALVTSIVPK